MPFNGAGQFNRLYNWQQDAANGLDILAPRMDAEMDGFAAGLSNCLTRDGQGVPSAAINWGGQNLYGVNALTGASMSLTGNATVAGTLGVTGAVTLAAALTANGPSTFGSVTSATGITGGSLTINGSGTITAGLLVNGTATVGALTSATSVTAGSLTVNGNATTTGIVTMGAGGTSNNQFNINTAGSTTSLNITDTGGSGAGIGLRGNGSTTPNKFIRAKGGNLEILNSAYSGIILTLEDSGRLTAAGLQTAPGFGFFSGTSPNKLYVNIGGNTMVSIDGSGNIRTLGTITANAVTL